MDTVSFYRRRRRNRPSLHPRVILLRQSRYRTYKQRRLGWDARNRSLSGLCHVLSYALAIILGSLVYCSSSNTITTSSAAALLSYGLYKLVHFLRPFSLGGIAGASTLFGSYSTFIPLFLSHSGLLSHPLDTSSKSVGNRRQRRQGPRLNVLVQGATSAVCMRKYSSHILHTRSCVFQSIYP